MKCICKSHTTAEVRFEYDEKEAKLWRLVTDGHCRFERLTVNTPPDAAGAWFTTTDHFAVGVRRHANRISVEVFQGDRRRLLGQAVSLVDGSVTVKVDLKEYGLAPTVKKHNKLGCEEFIVRPS